LLFIVKIVSAYSLLQNNDIYLKKKNKNVKASQQRTENVLETAQYIARCNEKLTEFGFLQYTTIFNITNDSDIQL